MAIKTFTTGEVLTAADTNTYLANSGLVYITSVSLAGATAASPVAITSCFSSTYTNYRIVVSNFINSTAAFLQFQLYLHLRNVRTDNEVHCVLEYLVH